MISSINLNKEKTNKAIKKKKNDELNEIIINNSKKVEKDKEKEDENNYIINKIKINKACIYLCFLCTRKRKNVENILLNKGKKLIERQLDIRNIFTKLYWDDNNLKYYFNIKMSDICKKNIEELGKIKGYE